CDAFLFSSDVGVTKKGVTKVHMRAIKERRNMKTIDVQTVSTSLKDLVQLTRQEAEVVLTEGERPVARVMFIQPEPEGQAGAPALRKLGLHPGAIETSEDFD